MKLEDSICIGDKAFPKDHITYMSYDSVDLYGTYKIGDVTISFWRVESPLADTIAYAYVELSEYDETRIAGFMRGEETVGMIHPLFRRNPIVIGICETDSLYLQDVFTIDYAAVDDMDMLNLLISTPRVRYLID